MKNYSGNKNSGNKNSGNKNSGDNHSQDGSHEKKTFHGPYSSNIFNAPIVNAITGVKYPWKVGSKDEGRLFKMVDATGTCDAEGKLYRKKDIVTCRETNHLYYDTPEQCMRHLKVSFNADWIQQWRNRVHERFSLL